MSKDLSRQGNLPSQEKVNTMKDDLTFKERQLEASKTTQERLEAELTKRQRELEKIDNLDKKIELELGSLQKKMVSMKDQMENVFVRFYDGGGDHDQIYSICDPDYGSVDPEERVRPENERWRPCRYLFDEIDIE